jgi:outer membrane protein assembly factor BamB
VHYEQRRRRTIAVLVAFTIVGAGLAVYLDGRDDGSGTPDQATHAGSSGGTTASTGGKGGDDKGGKGSSSTTAGKTTFRSDYDGWVDPMSFGKPYPNAKLAGLLTFRGNPTRSYYGRGPVPSAPAIAFQFPAPNENGMCSTSSDRGVTKTWCGLGWTGQPIIFDRGGRRWAVFGGYDGHVHFMDAKTGERILPDLPTGDLIKGTPTADPDGLPLIYSGSRDNYFRVIAIDRPEPTVLYKLHADAVSPVMWNDDWDSSPAVIGDYVFEGGENSQFHVIKLNKRMGADGKVTVAPQLVWHTPGWDQELLDALRGFEGPKEVSIENSPTIVGNTVYFANSGGLVQGWDISGLEKGRTPKRVFRYWTGEDTDATIVADDKGFLYVASEYERHTPQGKVSGQLMKLDPRKPTAPLVWKVDDQGASKAGIWGTPGIYKDTIYAGTNTGRVFGVDRATGAIRWEKHMPGGPVWGSPVIVDGVLLIGDCAGGFHAYDVRDTKVDPPLKWTVSLGSCIEATPAVWEGTIYIGTRGGRLYALKDP